MKKYVNGKYIELTQEEIEELKKQEQEALPQQPTLNEEVQNLKTQNEILTQCLLEMSEILYS